MTVLLALDSACASCSAAIWQDETILAQKFEAMPRGQSENLLPFVADVLQKAETSLDAMDALAVTVGPGAFTGIRICLSAARGLALATKKPLVGVTTMEALLAAQNLIDFDGALVAVLIETKRQDFYVQLFDGKGQALDIPQALLAPQILSQLQNLSQEKPIFLCGDGVDRFQQMVDLSGFDVMLGDAQNQPDAGIFGAVALAKLKQFGPEKFMIPPQPLYLRPPDATPPKPKFQFRVAGNS